MKTKLILCAMLFSAGTLFLNAQPPLQNNRAGQGQGQGQLQGQNRELLTPEARVDRMAKHLELTEAQKAKVLELCKQEDLKMEAMREEVKANSEKGKKLSDEHRQKFAAEKKSHDAALEKIIGAEKFTKWQADRTALMQKANYYRGNLNTNAPRAQKSQINRYGMKANRQQNIKENLSPENRAARLKTELNLTDAEKDALVQLFISEQKKIAEERKQHIEATKKSHDAEMEKIIGKEKMTKYKEIQNSRIENAKKIRKAKQV